MVYSSFQSFTLRYISALWIFGRQFTLDDHPSFEAENRGVVRSKSDPRQDLAISADSSIISPSLKAKGLGIIRDEDLAHAPVYKPWLFCPVKTLVIEDPNIFTQMYFELKNGSLSIH